MDVVSALNSTLSGSFGQTHAEDARLQAMTQEQLARFQAAQWLPATGQWRHPRSMLSGAQNSWRIRQPTMTLAEWDARRAAFNTRK